ncbi:hypothetical protein JXA70_11240 [candidate division KSB1 bacterium]|nr:hypothetical protein [candidate division KSB1 bacterium]
MHKSQNVWPAILMSPALLLFFCLTKMNCTQSAKPVALDFIASYNTVLGTQTIGAVYQFSDDTDLVETARRIREMDSNILKISLDTKKYPGTPDGEYTLSELVTDESSFKAVFDMDFAYYHLWAYPRDDSWYWIDGMDSLEVALEYEAIYNLAATLLQQYSGSGKVFYIGHWEGDWHLVDDYNRNQTPSAVRLQGTIDWMNIRQKAVDDAKAQTPHKNVQLYHYTEVNLVRKSMDGDVAWTSHVLPFINPDYVSWSCYESLGGISTVEDARVKLWPVLDYIESKLEAKSNVPGKRVWIGEYGFPFGRFRDSDPQTPNEQNIMSLAVAQAALEWGTPFCLYWEFYNNVIENNRHAGFWMVDSANVEQPVYTSHKNYYEWCVTWLRHFQEQHNVILPDSLFRVAAVSWLNEHIRNLAH